MSDSAIVLCAASSVPKYRQIVESVLDGVQHGRLKKGDPLPSINELSRTYALARDTVVKAYNELKEKGLIESRQGKGFFVATSHYARKANVFVLFDVLSTPYKERLYKGIRDRLKGRANLDFYFHHHNPRLFCNLLHDAVGKYEYYVVMPFPNDDVRRALSGFDQDKLLLLDIDIEFSGKRCAVIRQSHDVELERALTTGTEAIRRYEMFTLVFPEDKNHPAVIKDAFRRFCRRNRLKHCVVAELTEKHLRPGRAFLVIEDDDLVRFVKYIHANALQAGRDVGIVSYNDTPFKEIIEGGVTVVSIDFAALGCKTADQILHRSACNVLQPTELIMRGSL